ncbi:MAG: SDR family NAD(P)-dependent oxidoreductase, partial [Betaproteobacteria bacterium]|nr:SDR family NAD(P)-dependent oxidoreductase [Betaproteobacteria bacterium]
MEGMRQAGMPETLVQAMSSLNRIIAAGWVTQVTDDVSRLLGRPATAW